MKQTSIMLNMSKGTKADSGSNNLLGFLKKNYVQLKTMLVIKLLLVAASILLSVTIAKAQTQAQIQSQTSVGLRLGSTSGLSIKKAIAGADLEGIIGVSPSGLSFTGLYEISKPTSEVSQLYWYYGAGGHATIRGSSYYVFHDRYYAERYYGGALGLGIDGILGLEYRIREIPFSISLDLKPYVEINTDGLIYLNPDPGLGVKFRF